MIHGNREVDFVHLKPEIPKMEFENCQPKFIASGQNVETILPRFKEDGKRRVEIRFFFVHQVDRIWNALLETGSVMAIIQLWLSYFWYNENGRSTGDRLGDGSPTDLFLKKGQWAK